MPDEVRLPLTVASNGIRLTVRVTPRAGRSALAGIVPLDEGRSAVAVRLAASPVDGAANAMLCSFLAAQLGIPKSRVAIVAGHASRIKIVTVSGDPEGLACRLRELLQSG